MGLGWDGMVVTSSPSFRVGCPFWLWLGMSVSPSALSPVVPCSGTVAASTQAALVSRALTGPPRPGTRMAQCGSGTPRGSP